MTRTPLIAAFSAFLIFLVAACGGTPGAITVTNDARGNTVFDIAGETATFDVYVNRCLGACPDPSDTVDENGAQVLEMEGFPAYWAVSDACFGHLTAQKPIGLPLTYGSLGEPVCSGTINFPMQHTVGPLALDPGTYLVRMTSIQARFVIEDAME